MADGANAIDTAQTQIVVIRQYRQSTQLFADVGNQTNDDRCDGVRWLIHECLIQQMSNS